MTQDFVEDLVTACTKEGATYLIVTSTDGFESCRYWHNFDRLPSIREYPDGRKATVREDFIDFINNIPFTKEECE